MEIDRFELKNLLTTKYTKKIINTIVNESESSRAIDDIVVQIATEALEFIKLKRSERKINISPLTNLTDDQRDGQGRRRYKLACVDDDPVMVPDSGGFWTPVDG